jgi:hypothetical protein
MTHRQSDFGAFGWIGNKPASAGREETQRTRCAADSRGRLPGDPRNSDCQNSCCDLLEVRLIFRRTESFMKWRWDQGRMSYFRFDTIKRIAGGLCSLENTNLRASPDPLRGQMVSRTSLPFAAPETHSVWRNYKRVFGCCLLATEIDGRLISTEICHRIAADSPDEMAADVFFVYFAKRFFYPSPVFEGYASRGAQYFPVCAILKLLLARLRGGRQAVVSINEIIQILVANQCTGEETVEHYARLIPQQYTPTPDEVRQVRELVRFISQMSVLKWVQPNLYLDVDAGNTAALRFVEKLAQPEKHERKPDAARELLELGKTGDLRIVPLLPAPAGEADLVFSEGKPKRVTHLRYERSSKLREFYLASKQPPFLCDMCFLDVTERYPWTINLLEVHHLLPLASPLRVEERRTSLSELVGVCPNCHKATHLYYKSWLDDHNQDDFASYGEAREVYRLAKTSIVIHN